MIFTNQTCNLVEQKGFTLKDIKKCIEQCARVSYKSEYNITEESYIKFVDNLIKNNHLRPLEFGTIHIKMDIERFLLMREYLLEEQTFNNMWFKWEEIGGTVYITTNYRYYLYIISHLTWVKRFFTEEDSNIYPKRYTIHMVLSRGIMDEFRTHIGLSHLAESTRYCNYSKDKFNNKVTFIIPCWVNTHRPNKENEDPSIADLEWSNAMESSEKYYFSLLAKGWKPQQARSVLPLEIKSELISCGFKDAWDNFLEKRCAKDAHPMSQEIANQIKELFK